MNIDGFVTLFRGRGDAYGSWEGGCIKQPLTRAVFAAHLEARTPIGVYPSVPSGNDPFCIWGCTDIDYDNYNEAALLQRTFAAVGVTAWVEKTRKGWHIWIFAEEPVPSKDMRNMQLAAHQVCGLKPREVNPKQANVTIHSFGNYVRLPYPQVEPHQRYMVDSAGVRIDPEAFIAAALATRVPKDKVEWLATHYREPIAAQIAIGTPTADMTAAASMLTPLGKVIWRNGPIEGRDRSSTLQHLAHECRKSNIATSDALMLVKDADQRWGKYSTRGTAGERELLKLVERAYALTPSI
jgi:hypothetical protein